MILIIESESNQCYWTVLNYNKDEILKTRTERLNPSQLDIFQICNILHGVKELYKLKEEIKFLLFYEERSMTEKYKLNFLLVFKDYFPNAKIHVGQVKL